LLGHVISALDVDLKEYSRKDSPQDKKREEAAARNRRVLRHQQRPSPATLKKQAEERQAAALAKAEALALESDGTFDTEFEEFYNERKLQA